MTHSDCTTTGCENGVRQGARKPTPIVQSPRKWILRLVIRFLFANQSSYCGMIMGMARWSWIGDFEYPPALVLHAIENCYARMIHRKGTSDVHAISVQGVLRIVTRPEGSIGPGIGTQDLEGRPTNRPGDGLVGSQESWWSI